MVSTAHKKYSVGVCQDDNRGKYVIRPNETPEADLQKVRQHINSFDRIESHYCRKQSQKEYLAGSLNISKMYSLYCEYCLAIPAHPVKPVSHQPYDSRAGTFFDKSQDFARTPQDCRTKS